MKDRLLGAIEEKTDVNLFLNWREMRVGQCGGCGLKIRFWARDGAKLTCPNCGMTHEVECDEMLDLTANKRTEVVLLVPVEKDRDWKQSDN